VFGDGQRRSLAGTWRFKVGQVSFQPDGQVINKIPTVLYNKMLHPMLPFAIKGVLWYQGESNANTLQQATAYREQFLSLVRSWRRSFGDGGDALPFLWVQLPNFGARDTIPPREDAWATQRESMEAALALPKTGRAITIDIGEADDIHPKDKRDVGDRLALVARRLVYGEQVVASGPTYRAHTIRGDTVIVEFANTAGGLTTESKLVGQAPRAPSDLEGFEVAGADHRFVWAKARIVGNRVYVWSDRVHGPVAVRYAWANNPPATLYNGAGLPAVPFRDR
jgi:sialate O-acetylesterase